MKTVMINGRISARSYRATNWCARSSAACWPTSTTFCMQSDESAQRHHRPRRRSGSRDRHWQPEVRFAAGADAGRARQNRASACCAVSRSPPPSSSSWPQHDEGRGSGGVSAFARIKSISQGALLIIAPRHTPRLTKWSAWRRTVRLYRRPPIEAADRRRRSAALDVVVPRHDWRAGADLPAGDGGVRRRQPVPISAATTFWSRPCSASRSCSGRTCTISRRSPRHS